MRVNSSEKLFQLPNGGCEKANKGKEECALNSEDRAVVDAINRSVERISDTVEHTKKIAREMSVSLIGRSNGTVVDEGGGRIGRLEKLVTWAITGVVGILVWLLAQLASKVLK